MRVWLLMTKKEKNEPDAAPFGYVPLGWDIQSRGDGSGGNDMTTVIVRAGDSLWSIAQNNQTSVEALRAANPQLRNPNLLRVGESLSLPQDSFERTGQVPSELSQSDFLKRFQGTSIDLDSLGRDERVSSSVHTALGRADRDRDGRLSGENELRAAFGVLDTFDRNGRRESIALVRSGRMLALGKVIDVMSQVGSDGSTQRAPGTRETPSLNAVSRGAVLELGDVGQPVKAMQSRLMQLGYPIGLSGRYDPETLEVVRRFQNDHAVEETGRFGPTTLGVLIKAEQQSRENGEALARFVESGGELGIGQSGATVVDLQRFLNRRGFGLTEDGIFGPATKRAVQAFQLRNTLAATGRVGASTFDKLKVSPRFDGLTGKELRAITPNLSVERAESLSGYLNLAMAEADISTPQRQAMFLGQVAHESGGFRYSEELASGAAYEWRRDLGNIYAGDGRRYKGRGFIQLTGRANYRDAGRALGLDLINNPTLAATDLNAARVAAWYWDSRDLNSPADQGNFLEVTRRINGGTNGYWDRMRYYNRAQEVLV